MSFGTGFIDRHCYKFEVIWPQNAKRNFHVSLVYPPTADIRLRCNIYRNGPCVDGSELARRIFTLQAWSVQPVFGLT